MSAPAPSSSLPCTLREIARQLGLPESTVRFYRDAFEPYVPAVGLGRRRRYPPEATVALRTIADGFARNLPREAISAELSPSGALVLAQGGRSVARVTNEELLNAIVNGEGERRELMWQMAREIVRMGEAVERQQAALAEVAKRLSDAGDRLLPGSSRSTPALAGTLPAELEGLREELTRERELVERLRRSKLELERRAAEAEAQLRTLEDRSGPRLSVLAKLLGRDPEPGRPS